MAPRKFFSGRLLIKGIKTMMTKEVNEWIRRVEQGNYSSWEIVEEFAQFARYLTKEELQQVKKRLDNAIKR